MGRPKRAAAANAEDAPAAKEAKTTLRKGDTFDVDLEVSLEDGSTVKLKEIVQDSGIIIFSYPRCNTGGCTKQATGFKDKYDVITAAGFKVYGVSADNPKPQTNWKTKVGMQFNLICDKEHSLLEALGFVSGGKIVRSHIVVAKGGEVLDVQSPVKPEASATEALAIAEAAAAEPATNGKTEDVEAAVDNKKEPAETETVAETQDEAVAEKAEAADEEMAPAEQTDKADNEVVADTAATGTDAQPATDGAAEAETAKEEVEEVHAKEVETKETKTDAADAEKVEA